MWSGYFVFVVPQLNVLRLILFLESWQHELVNLMNNQSNLLSVWSFFFFLNSNFNYFVGKIGK